MYSDVVMVELPSDPAIMSTLQTMMARHPRMHCRIAYFIAEQIYNGECPEISMSYMKSVCYYQRYLFPIMVFNVHRVMLQSVSDRT